MLRWRRGGGPQLLAVWSQLRGGLGALSGRRASEADMSPALCLRAVPASGFASCCLRASDRDRDVKDGHPWQVPGSGLSLV